MTGAGADAGCQQRRDAQRRVDSLRSPLDRRRYGQQCCRHFQHGQRRGLSTGGNKLTVVADDVVLGETVNAGAGTVLLQPSTAISVGLGDGSSGVFQIDGTEDSRITAALLEIGFANSGNIDVTAFDVPNVTTLVLRTDGTVSETSSMGLPTSRGPPTWPLTPMTGSTWTSGEHPGGGQLPGVAAWISPTPRAV